MSLFLWDTVVAVFFFLIIITIQDQAPQQTTPEPSVKVNQEHQKNKKRDENPERNPILVYLDIIMDMGWIWSVKAHGNCPG